MPIRVIYMSTPAFGIPTLEHLLADPRFDLLAVITQPDRPAGRGRALTPPPIKRAAGRLGVPVLQPITLRDKDVIAEIARLKPDIMAVVAYGQWIPAEVFDLPPYRSLNLHPSLLPRHRGAAPVVGALLAGDEEVGLSVIFVEKDMDVGDLVAQMRVPAAPYETTGHIMGRLAHLAAPFFLDAIAGWVAGEIVPYPQDHTGATWIDRLQKSAGLVDWALPAVEIERRCRAFSPWPGLYTFFEGRRLLIHAGRALPLEPEAGILSEEDLMACLAAVPGQVLALDAGVGVMTGDGVFLLHRVQLESRRAVSADAFVCGHPGFIGAQLTGPA